MPEFPETNCEIIGPSEFCDCGEKLRDHALGKLGTDGKPLKICDECGSFTCDFCGSPMRAMEIRGPSQRENSSGITRWVEYHCTNDRKKCEAALEEQIEGISANGR